MVQGNVVGMLRCYTCFGGRAKRDAEMLLHGFYGGVAPAAGQTQLLHLRPMHLRYVPMRVDRGICVSWAASNRDNACIKAALT